MFTGKYKRPWGGGEQSQLAGPQSRCGQFDKHSRAGVGMERRHHFADDLTCTAHAAPPAPFPVVALKMISASRELGGALLTS